MELNQKIRVEISDQKNLSAPILQLNGKRPLYRTIAFLKFEHGQIRIYSYNILLYFEYDGFFYLI